jgi:hypothetical protein
MKIGIVFKNKYEIEVECEEFTVSKCIDGSVSSLNITEATKNKPLYLDLNEIMLVYRKE